MTQLAIPPSGPNYQSPVPPISTEHAGTPLSGRLGDLSILGHRPEEYGADTTSSADAFRGFRQAHARPHEGSAQEIRVMDIAQAALMAKDTKTLHAMSRGELPEITEPDAIELGKDAAEPRLGAISKNHAEKGPAVGEIALDAIYYADPTTERPLKPLVSSESALYVDPRNRNIGAVHIDMHQKK